VRIRIDVGVHPLRPEQQAVADNLEKPENQWVFHPAVDGCYPATHDNDGDGLH
jgi:hypothetical protein